MKSNQNSEKHDITTAIVSNITVVVQIIAIGAIGLADMLKIQDLFQLKELINIANFAILILSLSLIGLFNYFRTNRDFMTPPDDQEVGWFAKLYTKVFGKKRNSFIVSTSGVKKFLTFLYILTLTSTFSFFYFTYAVMQNKESSIVTLDGLFQVVTYSLTLIGGSVIIYVWINDMFDKKNRFTEEDFIPNFKDALIKYEFIGTPTVKVKQNIPLDGGNKLLKIEIGIEGEKNFICSFDGKRIFSEVTSEEYERIKNPNSSSRQQ